MPPKSSPHTVTDATKALPPKPAQEARPDMRVRAVGKGWYPNPGEIRARERNVGDVFVLSKMEHYSPITPELHGWMEWAVTPPTIVKAPPQTTVPNRINSPMGVPAGNAPRMEDRAGEPGAVQWPDAQGNMQGSVNAVELPAGQQIHKGLDREVAPLPDKAPAQTKPEEF